MRSAAKKRPLLQEIQKQEKESEVKVGKTKQAFRLQKSSHQFLLHSKKKLE